jgi:hypothetical protein
VIGVRRRLFAVPLFDLSSFQYRRRLLNARVGTVNRMARF